MTGTTQLFGERYQLGETLGFGGMSEVHRGRDLRLGRDVAIKVLRADLARDPAFQNRFRREAQNAASLNHPAIVAVYDTGESVSDVPGEDGVNGRVPYIVMEYVDGETLRDMVKRDGALPPRRAMEILADVCAALDFSHRHGIVHRDVKPANIMLTRAGAVKVMDFGIARAINDGTATQTATAAVIGTAQYLSPEQARGETVDARSDVYATGCVLYELLTGTPPFVGDSPVAIAYQHVRQDPKPPSEVNPALPKELDAIVLKALNKNPLNRYQTAAEMRSDLVRALSGQAVHATPVMTDDERTELMRATPARTNSASLLAPPSRAAAAEPLEDDGRNAKRVWGIVGVGALLVAVLAAAIWVTVSITRQPDKAQELPVPDVVSLTYDEAVAKLRETGFTADSATVSVEVADSTQVGKVQAQNPSAATIRPTTEKVKLTLGVSQALVKVPNVIGKSQADADTAIKALKLTPVFTTETSAATDKDKAFRQDPVDGTDVKPGSTVNVVIGTGVKLIPMPDYGTLIGQPVDAVTNTLKSQGFEVYQQPTDSSKPVNEVIGISGANAGEQVQVGTPITVSFSNNALFTVPNIQNKTVDNANAALVEAGWQNGNSVQTTEVPTSNPGSYNRVISQDPGPDTEYNKNGVIKVTIGVPESIIIPDMRGLSRDQAIAALGNARFTGNVNYAAATVSAADAGKVVGQTPDPLSSASADSSVTLVIGVAPAPPPVVVQPPAQTQPQTQPQQPQTQPQQPATEPAAVPTNPGG